MRYDKPKKRLILILVLLLVGYGVVVFQVLRNDQNKIVLETPALETVVPKTAPQLSIEQIVSGYTNIWDMVFLDEDTVLFDERSGKLHVLELATKTAREVGAVPGVWAEGEGGLLGLTVDKDFAQNRTVYACHNHQAAKRTVRVVRFALDEAYRPQNFETIIDDIESKAGRHSGCRLVMDDNGHIWIGTGDSALGTAPQDPRSLAGKVLRVDRDGRAVAGNASSPFDERIYNFGHRNIQGLVLFNTPAVNGAVGLTSEHGPDVEDEINWILPGNFGWDPNGSGGVYDESVLMTDRVAFPDAISALWDSGDQTIAVAGLEQLTHPRWSAWQGWVAMATLKGKHLRLIQFDDLGVVQTELEILKDFGRLRAVRQAPNGDLFITTDNGRGQDGIVRVVPQ